MYFAIRDDDINYFTKPKEIEMIYSPVWDICPISLSVTPFQAGYPAWLFPERFRNIHEEFPLDANKELAAFLRAGCAAGRFSIMMHGYNHDILSAQPEFLSGADLAKKATEGKKYLEQVLGTKVKCFVPPHNALSRAGIEAVTGAGMDIVGIQSFRPSRRVLSIRQMVPFMKRNFYLRVLGEEYPMPLWVVDHWEIPFYSLGRSTSLEKFRAGFANAIKRNGCFCLSTHYWEFAHQMECMPARTVGGLFLEFWKIAGSVKDVVFTSVDYLPACFSKEGRNKKK